MKLKATIKASQVKKAFNEEFPFLKLEFFSKPHNPHAGNYKKDLIKEDITLVSKKKNGHHSLTISDDMSVSAVENLFSEIFDVSAQVFRKSGRTWLETSLTDDWTLKRQNDEGNELSYLS